MAEENSHSTFLSGEGHSTILLAHTKIFIRLILILMHSLYLHKKIHGNLTFVVQFANFSIRPNKGREQQKKILFFRATF